MNKRFLKVWDNMKESKIIKKKNTKNKKQKTKQNINYNSQLKVKSLYKTNNYNGNCILYDI